MRELMEWLLIGFAAGVGFYLAILLCATAHSAFDSARRGLDVIDRT